MKKKIELFSKLKLTKSKQSMIKGGSNGLPSSGRLDTMIIDEGDN